MKKLIITSLLIAIISTGCQNKKHNKIIQPISVYQKLYNSKDTLFFGTFDGMVISNRDTTVYSIEEFMGVAAERLTRKGKINLLKSLHSSVLIKSGSYKKGQNIYFFPYVDTLRILKGGYQEVVFKHADSSLRRFFDYKTQIIIDTLNVFIRN